MEAGGVAVYVVMVMVIWLMVGGGYLGWYMV